MEKADAVLIYEKIYPDLNLLAIYLSEHQIDDLEILLYGGKFVWVLNEKDPELIGKQTVKRTAPHI